MIITGGLNVYPKEIEQAIDALPGVIESAVVGVPHPDSARRWAAAATGAPGDVPAALRGQLAGFKLPKHVEVVEELPRNAMGKVQKNLLRERFAGLFAGRSRIRPAMRSGRTASGLEEVLREELRSSSQA